MKTRGHSRQLPLLLTVTALIFAACGKSDAPATPPAPEPTAAKTQRLKPTEPTEPETGAEETEAPSGETEVADTEEVKALPVRAPDEEKAQKRTDKMDPEQPAGRFILQWRKPKQRKIRELARIIADSDLFPELTGALNDVFIIPVDVRIKFENCDEVNAFYDSETHTISICWELIEDTANNFSRENADADVALASAMNSVLFIFFHELGHALIHILDLPITGREEDAVDQLATWLLLVTDNQEGGLMALDGAASFRHDAEAEAESEEKQATWDEHSLNEQRYFNITCWVYGSNPEGLAQLTASDDGPLPDERAEQCADEWSRISSAWERILAEHIVTD